MNGSVKRLHKVLGSPNGGDYQGMVVSGFMMLGFSKLG